ncbi:class I SAM-dependent methyltransferase [Nocardioides litoris]|uniref:class I SAM-dependent methyltransferase n=1 Tax=Nocardioides litoris TaxID=1926648 RepID=UPI0011212D72|nr:class I SAM-dependent methyltransferase [Nocardioides litoris]
MASTPVSDVRVDDEGIRFTTAADDQPVDVLFDGRRIGSFWTVRDTAEAGGARLWAWPRSLRPKLHGRTELALGVHGGDAPLWAREVSLGEGAGRIAVVDAKGNPLSLDKSQRLVRLFDSRSPEFLAPLLDTMEEVVGALQDAGIEPFLAYGTLLGAVREGGFIGHDSDVDLGYVSRLDHPADVMLESYRLQRHLVARGYSVLRYSGAAIKIIVTEPDGTLRGLDVFAGFLREGRLYLMGEVGTAYRSEWVFPLTEVEMAGRTFPAPAVPDRLLEAMYGPSWRVPDPAFKFETPSGVVRRLNGWFRGTRHRRESTWDPYWGQDRALTRTTASALVKWVHHHEPADRTLVDVGCGTGADVMYAARRGRPAYGLDYVPRAFGPLAARAERKGFPATFWPTNLTEVRSVVAAAAALRSLPGQKVVVARHLVDSTSALGRDNLLRLSRTVLTGGGRLHVQVLSAPGPAGTLAGLRPVDVDAFCAEVARHGGHVVQRTDGDVDGRRLTATPATPAHLSRLVVEWN